MYRKLTIRYPVHIRYYYRILPYISIFKFFQICGRSKTLQSKTVITTLKSAITLTIVIHRTFVHISFYYELYVFIKNNQWGTDTIY